jgi:hypothetical protein
MMREAIAKRRQRCPVDSILSIIVIGNKTIHQAMIFIQSINNLII